MPRVRSLQARDPDGLRRRAGVRARHGRRRTAGRPGRQSGAAIRRPVRQVARPCVRRRGHRPRRRLRHERREAFQVGTRRANQTPYPQDAERRGDSRLPTLARARDRPRSPAGNCLPRRHRGESAARARLQCHEEARSAGEIDVGAGRHRHGPSVRGAARAARSACTRRTHVRFRHSEGGALSRPRSREGEARIDAES